MHLGGRTYQSSESGANNKGPNAHPMRYTLDAASVVIGLEVWKSFPMAVMAGVCTLELNPTIPDIQTTVIV